MSTRRWRGATKNGRLLWGGLAVVLLVGLLATVLLSRGAVADSEAEAQRRAEDYTNTVLFNNLTFELVSKPILGPDYRDLIIAVQAGILSDDGVARVRIWTTDGLLVFSTDQRDKQGEYTAGGNAQIQAAADGTTVSLPTQATVAPRAGLAGSDEKLYQTFVPLRLVNELGIAGVSQIDQRYSAIESDANAFWRPLQIGLLAALVIVVALLLLALRRPAPAEAGGGVGASAAAPSERSEQEIVGRLRVAEEEAQAAQLRADKAEELLVRAEERTERAETAAREAEKVAQSVTAEPTRRGVPGVGAPIAAAVVASAELEKRVAAAESEREQMAGEVQRLRAALAERDAQLALAAEAGTSGEEETAKVHELAKHHEAKAAEAEALVAETARRAAEAEQRAAEADRRTAEAEAQLGAAEAARVAAEAAVAKSVSGEKKNAEAALRAAQLELNEVKSRLAETENSLTEATSRLAEGERGAETLEAVKAELAERDASLEAAETARAALSEELERMKGETATAAAATGSLGEATAKATELQRQVAELEDLRRTDVSELQRAQEALANTQIEATQAKKRAKDLEDRVRELEAAPPPAAAEEYGYEEVQSFAARLASLVHREAEPSSEPYLEPEPHVEPEPSVGRSAGPVPRVERSPARRSEPEPEPTPESDEGGLSLRERLARAAAARHRAPGVPPPEER
jgi:hypothetical protein